MKLITHQYVPISETTALIAADRKFHEHRIFCAHFTQQLVYCEPEIGMMESYRLGPQQLRWDVVLCSALGTSSGSIFLCEDAANVRLYCNFSILATT